MSSPKAIDFAILLTRLPRHASVSAFSPLSCAWAELMISDGTCVRDYLHIMDLAKGHVLALDALARPLSDSDGIFSKLDVAKTGYCRAFNLGKGKGMSVLNMIEAMKKASGYDFKYEIVGRR